MASTKSVEEIVDAIKALGAEEREGLLLQLTKIDELIEDLEDVLDAIRSERESERSFDEFVRDFESKQRDV